MAELVDSSGRVMFEGTIDGAGGGGQFVAADADPGALGAGAMWADTSADPIVVNVRDAADAVWTPWLTFPAEFTGGIATRLDVLDGAVHVTVDDGAGASMALEVNSQQVKVIPPSGNQVLQIDHTGAFFVAEPVNGFSILEVHPDADLVGEIALALNRGTDGATLFRVQGDGSMHGRAGKALTFDI